MFLAWEGKKTQKDLQPNIIKLNPGSDTKTH